MAPAYDDQVNKLRATFNSGKTTVAWRTEQLKKINEALDDFKDEICEAMTKDLGRPMCEILVAEYAAVVAEVRIALDNVAKWAKPYSVPHPLTQKPGESKVCPTPKGVVLIICPWNYPFNLSFAPLAAAIAAGNCCLLKPSECAPNCAQVIEKIMGRLDQSAITCVQGAVEETTALLKLQWDHIMYTGNGAVAKVVMRAAAEHLTPVTLELGGKSPVIIDEDAKLDVAVQRILWGKYLNCGQTCIAPDYILATEGVKAKLVTKMKEVLQRFYGTDAHATKDFGRIVNERHWDRIQSLLKDHGGQMWSLESSSPATRSEKFIAPTIVEDPSPTSKLMTEEIFGPVLPVLKVKNVEEAIEFVNKRDRPLALYAFSEKKATTDQILQNTISGGCCVNDVIYHIANPSLPFGGIGPSGCGKYHGKAGFEEFSHLRSVMWRPTWIDPPERYPPYKEANLKFLMKLLLGPIVPPAVKKALMVLGAALFAYLLKKMLA